ncbi:hypothetical protein [Paenibacillus sp. NPDC058071]|uniref:hypothetical protein n=1 Tax=Paenibacillus sp. NPDC058071 TaxID=3346326 RepID=UPI0036DE572B
MTEADAERLRELDYIIRHSVSLELRVPDSETKDVLVMMENYGFKYKVSWASMELKGYTVIDFWKKELVKL